MGAWLGLGLEPWIMTNFLVDCIPAPDRLEIGAFVRRSACDNVAAFVHKTVCEHSCSCCSSKGVWCNGSASDSRSEGWEFESLCPQRCARLACRQGPSSSQKEIRTSWRSKNTVSGNVLFAQIPRKNLPLGDCASLLGTFSKFCFCLFCGLGAVWPIFCSSWGPWEAKFVL